MAPDLQSWFRNEKATHPTQFQTSFAMQILLGCGRSEEADSSAYRCYMAVFSGALYETAKDEEKTCSDAEPTSHPTASSPMSSLSRLFPNCGIDLRYVCKPRCHAVASAGLRSLSPPGLSEGRSDGFILLHFVAGVELKATSVRISSSSTHRHSTLSACGRVRVREEGREG